MAQVRKEGVEILRVLCGSRAYGLHDEDSDYDYHSVYVVPTSRLLMLGQGALKNTQWEEGGAEDNTGWELGHFLNLATHCNPTVLETFVAPVVRNADGTLDERGEQLRALFPYVLSRKRVLDAFRGYASNQRKKMFEPYGEDKERRMRKAAVAYLRSLYHGQELLREGTYSPRIEDEVWWKRLRAIRSGEEARQGRVIDWAAELEAYIEYAYEHSKVQLEPDFDAVNGVLLQMRRENW